MQKFIGLAEVEASESKMFYQQENYPVAIFAEQDDAGVWHSEAVSGSRLEDFVGGYKAGDVDAETHALYSHALKQIEDLVMVTCLGCKRLSRREKFMNFK